MGFIGFHYDVHGYVLGILLAALTYSKQNGEDTPPTVFIGN